MNSDGIVLRKSVVSKVLRDCRSMCGRKQEGLVREDAGLLGRDGRLRLCRQRGS